MVTDPLTDLPTIKINLQQKITPKILPKVTTQFTWRALSYQTCRTNFFKFFFVLVETQPELLFFKLQKTYNHQIVLHLDNRLMVRHHIFLFNGMPTVTRRAAYRTLHQLGKLYNIFLFVKLNMFNYLRALGAPFWVIGGLGALRLPSVPEFFS